MSPQRIQLRRTKGWRKPEGVIVVARPTRWGNPHRLYIGTSRMRPLRSGRHGAPGVEVVLTATEDRAEAVARYRADLTQALAGDVRVGWHMQRIARELPTLRGRDLACWCPLDQPCHADVLLELANEEN